MDDIIALLQKSIEDDFLSKDEKKSFRQILGNRTFSADETASLERRIFEIAASHIRDEKSKFILDWVKQTTETLSLASSAQSSSAFFSPGESCRKAIMDTIGKATSHLKICVFTISDDSIVNAILMALRRGVRIDIITDNDKSFDQGSDVARLSKAGVMVRTDNTPAHMHHKFMIVDNRFLLNGSYNWTQSAARVNQENIIVTSEELLVKAFTNEFDRLWSAFAQ
jgi:mitochondrial cardiolipin hydrolase